jgi:hypothetical protein
MFTPFFCEGANFIPLNRKKETMTINRDETYLKNSRGQPFGPQKERRNSGIAEIVSS